MQLDLGIALELAGPLVASALVVGTLRSDLASVRLAIDLLRAESKELAKQIGDALKGVAVHDERIDALTTRITAVEEELVRERATRHEQRNADHARLATIEAALRERHA